VFTVAEPTVVEEPVAAPVAGPEVLKEKKPDAAPAASEEKK
jgi:hypothetical protein